MAASNTATTTALPQHADRVAPGYRVDINGLRAWAVAAVVLFHFGVKGFGGGFVGVDIFFVISGFLMTGIVVKGLERGGFSVAGFYMARVKRIVPALVALCGLLLVLGWWLLTPTDYKVLGAHAAASLSFLSNVKYFLEAGYFDAGSHEKWLLHTWSLAVEWQFYMLLPLALGLLWRFKPGRAAVTAALAAGLLASYALCVVLTPLKPSLSFFLLPTRAWEMLAGGLVFLLAPQVSLTPVWRKALEALGWLLALGCIAGLDGGAAWPGWAAVLPVLAASLILLASRQDSRWTANACAQWIGTRSYSIYLWHWPVVVALLYLDQTGQPLAIAAGMAATALLGHLSYRWVEVPSQSGAKVGIARKAQLALVSAVAFALAGVGVHMLRGVPGRLSPDIDRVSMEALNKNPRRAACHNITGVQSPSCVYGGPEVKAIVLGDSHADAVMSAVAAALPEPARQGVVQWSYSGCPTLQGSHRLHEPENRCGDFIEWALKKLQEVPKDIPVIIVNRHGAAVWGDNEVGNGQPPGPKVFFTKVHGQPDAAFLKEYADHLTGTACQIAKDRPVYLVRPTPEMGVNVPNSARAMVWGRQPQVAVSRAAYRERNGFVWAAQDAARDQCGVKILDPLPYLCTGDVCPGALNGRPLYYDDDHLSESGNKHLVGMFKPVFQPAEPSPQPSSPTSGRGSTQAPSPPYPRERVGVRGARHSGTVS
jgi:peptidoglycan/LPS O-acetylase OafA/YrhL